MSFYLQVLATDSIDSSACIAVFTESHRFLFNCGEGIQRLCVEHKVRLSKIRAVMFTDFSPHNVFGLPGLALTAADAGNNNIRIAGPAQIKSFLHTTRHFMKLPEGLLNFHFSTEQSSSVFNSSEIDLRMISFNNSQSTTPGSAHTEDSSQHHCFVGRTQELKGKFDLLKAQALNVPKGPLFGKLKNGQSITLPDGTIISPDQVLGESELCKYFIVVCSIQPQEDDLLLQITRNSELNRFQGGQVDAETAGTLHCMVHLSPAATVNTLLYQTWVKSFGPAVTHIYTGAGTGTTTHSSFLATTTTCNKMHLTTPNLFPSMHHVYTGLYTSQGVQKEQGVNNISAVPLLKFHLLRNIGVEYPVSIDCSAVAETLYNDVISEDIESSALVKVALGKMQRVKQVLTAHADTIAVGNSSTTSTLDTSADQASSINLGTAINNTAALEEIHSLYGVNTSAASQLLHSGVSGLISFLGTGCSIPSKYRNVSGILLQLHNTTDTTSCQDVTSNNPSRGLVNGFLVDAGEGTWAQIQRLAYESALKEHHHYYNTIHTTSNTVHNTINTSTTSQLSMLPTLSTIQHTLSSQLRVVWISHPHADHHLGLVRVIIERKAALSAYNTTLAMRTDNRSAERNTESISGNAAFEPLIVIAPPSILAFLYEFSALYPYMQGAYIGVSCRSYDPDDSCVYTDCYWNKTLLNNCNNNDKSEYSMDCDGTSVSKPNSKEGLDATKVSEEGVAPEHKRQRTQSPDARTSVADCSNSSTDSSTNNSTIYSTYNSTGMTDATNPTTSTTTSTTTSAGQNYHKKHHHGEMPGVNHTKKTTTGFQYFIDTSGAAEESAIVTTLSGGCGGSDGTSMISDMLTDTTNTTICGMDKVNAVALSANATAATSVNADKNSKSWRNFKHIFKEHIPADVLKLASEAKNKADQVLHKMGVVELKNVQVVHCGQSYGLCISIVPTVNVNSDVTTTTATNTSVTIPSPSSTNTSNAANVSNTINSINPIKLVYSGDTRPCPRLIEIGADATILIHEATFEDTKQEEAIMKRHSTMSEAYQVGVEMKAFRTIFTHFSQRYPGVPLLAKYSTNVASEPASAENNMDFAEDNTGSSDSTSTTNVESLDPVLAFDYMQLSFTDLLWAPASTAVFSAAFPGKISVTKGGEVEEE